MRGQKGEKGVSRLFLLGKEPVAGRGVPKLRAGSRAGEEGEEAEHGTEMLLCGQSRVTGEERLARRNVTGMENRPRAWESRAVPFVEDWLSGAICDVTGGVVRVFQVG